MSGDAHRGQAPVSHTTAWVVGVLTAVVVYVLSPGPVAWWIHHRNGGVEPEWMAWLYAPLIFGCEHIDSLAHAYHVYFDWWIN
jgi:hypothetical protein